MRHDQHQSRSTHSTCQSRASARWRRGEQDVECTQNKEPTAVHVIALDYSKAFDRVGHNTLLQLLQTKIQLPQWALRWASNHMKHRMNKVRVGNSFSRYEKFVSGVPQGASTPAPLFNCSVSALADVVLSDGAHFQMYADDAVYVKARNTAQTLYDIKADLTLLLNAGLACGQTLNIDKTTALLCSISPIAPSAPNIILNNQVISYKPTICYLGIILDIRLNFQEHLRMKVSKAQRLLGATVGVLQRYNPKHLIGRIWQHVIKPIVSYGWYLTSGKTKAGDDQMDPHE